MDELQMKFSGPLIVYQDNQSGIRIMLKSFGNFKRTKHYINKFHWIRQYVENGTIEFKYLPTKQMISDIFTKALVGYLFYVLLVQVLN
jgi:hypothetical protein